MMIRRVAVLEIYLQKLPGPAYRFTQPVHTWDDLPCAYNNTKCIFSPDDQVCGHLHTYSLVLSFT